MFDQAWCIICSMSGALWNGFHSCSAVFVCLKEPGKEVRTNCHFLVTVGNGRRTRHRSPSKSLLVKLSETSLLRKQL